MNKNRSMSPNVFFCLVAMITAAVVAAPQWAFAETPSSGQTATTSLPPPPPQPSSATTSDALPPPPPPPSGSQPPAASQGAPPAAYPNAWGPYPPAVPSEREYNKMYPKELPYKEGAETPMGYRKVERPRKALIIAGAATFGGLYAITLFGALSSNQPKYAIPVVGPFLGIELTSGNSWDGLVTTFANFIFVFDGLGQAGGLALLIAGTSKKTTLVRNDVATLEPEFSVGPGSISMHMRF